MTKDRNPDDPRHTVNEPDDDSLRRTIPETRKTEADEESLLKRPNQIFDDQLDKQSGSLGNPASRKTMRDLLDTKTEFDRKRIAPVSLPDSESTSRTTDERMEQAAVYRPAHRPATPILYMMDDNQVTGEAIRLRAAQTLIGRGRGDITVPNDAHVSERHVEIRRELVDGRYRWHLNDLKSTNGTYVRILKQDLAEGDCLLFGERYFRFSIFDPEPQTNDPTRYALVQFAQGKGETRRLFMLDPDKANLIGREQQDFEGNVWDDSFLDSEHAELTCSEGFWKVEDLGSLNGTWVRTQAFELVDGISFQLGGQRFTFSLDEV